MEHKTSRMIGRVTGFAHDGTIDVFVDHTGPYKQDDFHKLTPKVKEGEPGAPARADGSCSCRTFSECTHK